MDDLGEKMNKSNKKAVISMLLCTYLIAILSVNIYANSAEPPAVIILVNNPPRDLEIVMTSSEQKPIAQSKWVAWEGYYRFYSSDISRTSQYTFVITTGGKQYEYLIDKPENKYTHVYTLDLSKQVLISGTYPFRTAILVSLRVIFTLVIEGIIFWLFQFRSKRSWIIFFVLNLLTQGALNIWLFDGLSVLPNYLIFSLVYGEFFVFIAEMVGFALLIKEQKKGEILGYVFIANFISLFVGAFLIDLLPV